VAVAIVGESVIRRRKLLQTLRGNGGKISRKFCVLCKNHGPTSHKAIDQSLLPHLQTQKQIAKCAKNKEKGVERVRDENASN